MFTIGCDNMNEEIENLELETKKVKVIDPNSKIEVKTYTGDEDYLVQNHDKNRSDIDEGIYVRTEKDEKTSKDKIVPNSEIAVWTYNDESTGLNVSTIGDKSGPPKEGTYVKIKYEEIVVEKDTFVPAVSTNNTSAPTELSQKEKIRQEQEKKREEKKKKIKKALALVIIPIVVITAAKGCEKIPDQPEPSKTEIVQVVEQDIVALIEEADQVTKNIRDVVRNSEMQPAAIEDDQTLLGQPVTHTVQEGNVLIQEGDKLANDCETFIEKASNDQDITYDEAVEYIDEGIEILNRVGEFYENDKEMMQVHLQTNQEIEDKNLRTEATHYEGKNTAGQIKLRENQISQIQQTKKTFVETQEKLVDTDKASYEANKTGKTQIQAASESKERGR